MLRFIVYIMCYFFHVNSALGHINVTLICLHFLSSNSICSSIISSPERFTFSIFDVRFFTKKLTESCESIVSAKLISFNSTHLAAIFSIDVRLSPWPEERSKTCNVFEFWLQIVLILSTVSGKLANDNFCNEWHDLIISSNVLMLDLQNDKFRYFNSDFCWKLKLPFSLDLWRHRYSQPLPNTISRKSVGTIWPVLLLGHILAYFCDVSKSLICFIFVDVLIRLE